MDCIGCEGVSVWGWGFTSTRGDVGLIELFGRYVH